MEPLPAQGLPYPGKCADPGHGMWKLLNYCRKEQRLGSQADSAFWAPKNNGKPRATWPLLPHAHLDLLQAPLAGPGVQGGVLWGGNSDLLPVPR